MINYENGLRIVRQLYKSGGVNSQEIYDIAYMEEPTNKSLRVGLLSYIIDWAESGTTEEHQYIFETTAKALRKMVSED